MESYYNFYYNNEEKIKKYFRYAGYGGLSFLGGFVLFYLFNFKRTKKIQEKEIEENIKDLKVEDLRKLLRKLINSLFLKMSHSFDKNCIIKVNPFEDLNSENLEKSLSSFIGNNIEIESEKVEEVQKAPDVVEIDNNIKSPTEASKPDEKKILADINIQSKIFFLLIFFLVWKDIQENIRIEMLLLKKFDLDKNSYREAIKKFSNDS